MERGKKPRYQQIWSCVVSLQAYLSREYSIVSSVPPTVNAQDPLGGEASGYVGEILFFTVMESSIVTPDF